jgi:hypothetical protein
VRLPEKPGIRYKPEFRAGQKVLYRLGGRDDMEIRLGVARRVGADARLGTVLPQQVLSRVDELRGEVLAGDEDADPSHRHGRSIRSNRSLRIPLSLSNIFPAAEIVVLKENVVFFISYCTLPLLRKFQKTLKFAPLLPMLRNRKRKKKWERKSVFKHNFCEKTQTLK